jgi:hypothetical protein
MIIAVGLSACGGGSTQVKAAPPPASVTPTVAPPPPTTTPAPSYLPIARAFYVGVQAHIGHSMADVDWRGLLGDVGAFETQVSALPIPATSGAFLAQPILVHQARIARAALVAHLNPTPGNLSSAAETLGNLSELTTLAHGYEAYFAS